MSPVLANVCLHVLDEWFQRNWSSKEDFAGNADDAVFVFSDAGDAHAFQQALATRMS